jgi:GMP synthase (glutamine-hydrolysing)
VIDAEERFLKALAGVTDPERKRKIIGAEFIAVFEEEATKVGDAAWLAQGTLYPDVIESVSVRRPVGGDQDAPQRGRAARAHEAQAHRTAARAVQGRGAPRRRGAGRAAPHPVGATVPRSGLAVRCLGEITRERLVALRAADAIIEEEIRAAGLYESIWQSFGVLLPVRSVGVMGDLRTYSEALALRAVTRGTA